MTREEYLQLVQGSGAFKSFEKKLQEKILAATGKKMEKYASIFRKAQKAMAHATQDFVTKNAEILKNLTTELKNVQKEKLQNDEEKAVKEDQKNQNILLHQLDTL